MKIKKKYTIFLLLIMQLVIFNIFPGKSEAFNVDCTSGGPWWISGYANGPDTITTGQPSDFFAVSATANPGGSPIYLLTGWLEFGDGSQFQSMQVPPPNNTPTVSVRHTYDTAGTYIIKLHAWAENGGSGVGCTGTASVVVNDPVSPTLATVCAASNINTSWVLSGPTNSYPYSGNSFCVDDTAGNWTISGIPAIAGYNGPFLSPSTATQTVAPEGSISWNITYTPIIIIGGPVNGSCGSAAGLYPPSATGFAGSFCSAGNPSPSSSAFPGQGSSVSWSCLGTNGGTNASCTATHQSAGPQPAIGTLDGANCSVIGGWAFDPDSSSASIGVHIYKDGPAGVGTYVGAATADGSRPDVNSVYGITGNHGFTISTPASLVDGNPHTVYVHALDSNGTPNNVISGSGITVNCPVVADNSAYISQNVPIRMVPGQTYPVSIVMKNTGTTNWTSSSAYALGSQNPQDNITWFGGRVGVPATISPGTNGSFNFNVKAPSVSGTYNFQTRMTHDLPNGSIPSQWFGEFTPNLSIVVQPMPDPTNLTVTCPSPGTTVTANWTAPSGYNTFYIRANPGVNNWTYPSAIDNNNFVGSSYTFTSTPGQAYSFWLHTKDPVTGDFSTGLYTNVVCAGASQVDGATFISQNVPVRLNPGASTNVSVTMQNSGSSTWLPASQYALGSQNPQDNTIFGTSRQYVSSSVAPGAYYTFNYSLSCPNTPGTYYFQNKMTHDAPNGSLPAQWFGPLTPNTPVQCQPVKTPTNLTFACPSPGTTAYANWSDPSGYNHFLIRVNQGANNSSSPAWIMVPENGQSGIGNSYSFNTTPGQSYYMWLHAQDPATGEYSTAIAANVKCAPPPPSNLTLSCPSPGNQVNASWTNPGGYSNFLIRANPGLNNNTYPSAISNDNYTGTTYSFPATPGQTYFYWMHTLDPVTNEYSAAITGNVSCVNTPINGQCGTANGKNYGSAVTTYSPDTQCNSGVASDTSFPTNGNSVKWTCSGQNGGSASPQCSASRSSSPINGTCGTADGKTYPSSTTTYSPDTQCTNGTPSTTAFPIVGGSQSWTCSGQNGGIPASCSASRQTNTSPIDGMCGTADSKVYLSTDTGYLPETQCTNGTPSSTAFPAVGGSQSWTCSGQNGGSVSPQCSASRQSGTGAINGTCGTADGKTYPSSTTTYSPDTQCTNGTPSSTAFPAAGFSQTWTCSGQNGGSASPQCLASRSATSGNSGPTAPVVSCTNCGGTSANPTGFTGTNYNFNMSCTDPDGDQVAYGIDWDADSVLDELVPASGYVNSGTSKGAVNSWTTSGSKSIGFISFDSNGNWSPWVIKNITISNSQVNGVCGSANRTYMSTDTSYGGDNLCSSGSISSCSQGSAPNCSFPSAGSSVTWVCAGAFGGSSASCQADRAASLKLVNVSVSNLSGGSVNGPGINCGYSCSATYALNSTISLNAVPTSAYWQFTGWGGDCASFGRAKTCTLTVDGDKTVTATFLPRAFNYSEF